MSHGHPRSHSQHHHHHDPQEKRALQIRLSKVAGQIRAIDKMVDADIDCAEILTQIVSVRKALKSFAEVIIQQHTESCIAGTSDPLEGQRRLKELLTVLRRYVE
ncbi:MAG TPA: metal-sensitive transcriptional regulator [Candidatus Methylacidiphilales bacterium]|nr:metal-sensitive transcriptional regulator [Candidatus Methylacidiphilales bacterium]